ncbi:hypothetical protein [uncultured Desulfuromusa sp.]|uniref:hypothetical protein n=1 Tax=uncultured Desulfuromusa sp. TaxID=219183 RepID=UPI002AA86390|nr:hypothetical protein [uncultured Desulfuromusa sp.]
MNEHLQQFAHQLAIWAETIIEHGRTPFRRVDTYPIIDTAQGIKSPPLIFWINRQSMMAGGILLLPENDLASELQVGCSCATALGLRHFVTWEANCVRIWRVEKEQPVEHQSFPLSNPDQPETFRLLLAEILDTLKLLAVLGAIPAKELTPYYFNNLFQITLEQALPPLTEAYRSQRSEADENSTEDTDTSACEANRLRLLQVLALLWLNKCPESIMPEKMEQAIALALLEVPAALKQALSFKTTTNPPQLPLESAVVFHHLLLRLRQLAWTQEKENVTESIYRLAEFWFQSKSEEEDLAAVYLYPETPDLSSGADLLLSNSPSLLAISALSTEITNSSAKRLICGNLFDLHRDSLPEQKIAARLLNQNRITTSERRKYTTALRSAWPNRHLKIKAGQSFWLWELVHLLGLCDIRQNLSLEIPVDLLNDSEAQIAWTLLCENYSFQGIQLLKNNNLKFRILRDKSTQESFFLKIKEETREIVPIENPICFKNQLLLALNLPGSVYKLLGNEIIWPDADSIPCHQLPGWETYTQSRLYKWMLAILPGHDSENSDPLKPVNSCIPYPEPLQLKELEDFSKNKPETKLTETIDLFLATLLACPAVADLEPPKISKTPRFLTSENHSEKNLKEAIAQQLAAHGIPNFPAQYLYFLDHPVMCSYTFTPPLVLKNSLLGEFELEDAEGQMLSVYGEELKQILLICSESGRTEIDLPKGRHQLEQLLQYYLKDLETLYNHLSNLCYSQIKDSKSARKMIKNTWKRLNLPKPAWFRNPKQQIS